jgi:adenosylcobinamide kinase / adenosylcobinamide-phosphate guanylyltransferase
MLTLVLGGTRSGKSRYAQQLARQLSATPLYVATSRAWDAAHQERIATHQRDRGPEWRTLECELELDRLSLDGEVAVIDCVTLWLTNFFSEQADVAHCLGRARHIVDRLAERRAQLLLVSNELGQSLHAPTELGRKFVDLQGLVNQHIAARATNVACMVAGIPLYVKGAAPSAAAGAPHAG